MIEKGKIVKKEKDLYEIEIPLSPECKKCKLCLSFVKPDTNRIVIVSKKDFNVGEEVDIIFDDRYRLKMSMILFLVPVISGIILSLILNFLIKSPWAAPTGGVGGFAISLILIKLIEKKLVQYPEIRRRRKWEI